MENRVYEEFEPTSQLVNEESFQTLLLDLPGFKREQLRVQLTRTQTLIVRGERPLGGNKWSRFRKEFPIPTNCDAQTISARFEDPILYVKQPLLITPTAKRDDEKPPEAPKRQKPVEASEPQPAEKEQEQASGTKTAAEADNEAKQTEEKTNGSAQATTLAEEEAKNVNEKRSEPPTDAKYAAEKVAEMEKGTNDTGDDEKTTEYKNEIKQDGNSLNKDGSGEMMRSSVDDDRRKTKVEDYRQAVDNQTVKMPNKVMSLVMVILLAVSVGLFIAKLIRSLRTAEESEL